MARVKHRKIKSLIYGETFKVKDSDFFTSKEFHAYLQDILDVISCSYDTKKYVRVSVTWDPNEKAKVACTDSETLFINAGTHLMKDVTDRADRFEGVLGLMLHENGHLLYTNFKKSTEITHGIMGKRLIMVPDKKYTDAYDVYEQVRDYLSTIKNQSILQMVCRIWQQLSNCLEDGHVDWRVGSRYPGYKPYLDYVNDLCYEFLPSVTEIRQKRLQQQTDAPDDPIFMIYDFLQYLLMYSRYGFLKGEDREIAKEEAALKVYDLIDWIDFAKEAKNSMERLMYQSIVFYMAFPFDYIDSLLEKYGNEENSTVSENSQKSLEEALQSGQSAQGISSSSDSTLSSSIAGNQQGPIGDNEKEEETSESNGDSQEKTSSEETPGDETDHSEQNSQGSDEDAANSEVGGCSSDTNADVTEQDEEVNVEKAKSLSHKKRSEKEREKGLASAEKDMQRVLDKMSKNENLRVREKHFESELNSFAASVNHRSIHRDVESEVRRIEVPKEPLIEAYNNIWPQISPISKKLQGKLKRQLEKKRKGYKQNNLYFGRKLEVSSLARGDGKCFSKKNLPANKKELAVALLVDESGSMRLADRITHARIASLILYDFCHELRIPVSVYGHSAGHPEVRLNAYAEYDSVDKNDRYRIMSMDCSGCNRDGYALRYVADRLQTQNAEIKLLFIVSDGKPADTGYSGEEAYEDLASIKKEYRNKGIITIAAAIGNDKETIEHIYGKEAFLDVSDLEKLPENLISIVKKYL